MIDKNILMHVKDLKRYFPITQGMCIQLQVGDTKAGDGGTFDIGPG